MKSKILFLLKNSPDYVSGEYISSKLDITRSAVWKHIKALKNDGYIIEGVSKKGYKLISSPSCISSHEIKSNLKTKNLAHSICYLDNVDSTNKHAKQLAINGAKDGTLVISKTQFGGKGRFERNWVSPEGGIWASLILRPNIEPFNAPRLTLIAAAAITKTLNNFNLDIKIKWPNDLLINCKKFCGILTEMSCDLDGIKYIILGFGINVNISGNMFPKDVTSKATSLYIESGENINISKLLCDILYTFEEMYNKFIDNNDISDTIDLFRSKSMLIGKDIQVSSRLGSFTYTCVDISDNGELLVRDSENNIIELSSGEVSLNKNYQKNS